jgi:hypothetical protein
MPALTMERTTAFIPALSPPDVSIAIFIVLECVQASLEWSDGR